MIEQYYNILSDQSFDTTANLYMNSILKYISKDEKRKRSIERKRKRKGLKTLFKSLKGIDEEGRKLEDIINESLDTWKEHLIDKNVVRIKRYWWQDAISTYKRKGALVIYPNEHAIENPLEYERKQVLDGEEKWDIIDYLNKDILHPCTILISRNAEENGKSLEPPVNRDLIKKFVKYEIIE